MDTLYAEAYYQEMIHEKALVIHEVDEIFRKDLSHYTCQEELYECPRCEAELESRDVIGFDLRDGVTCIGYRCPDCNSISKRPATSLDYKLFLESLSSFRSNKNRHYHLPPLWCHPLLRALV